MPNSEDGAYRLQDAMAVLERYGLNVLKAMPSTEDATPMEREHIKNAERLLDCVALVESGFRISPERWRVIGEALARMPAGLFAPYAKQAAGESYARRSGRRLDRIAAMEGREENA